MLSVAITLTVGASLLGFASVVGAQTPPPLLNEVAILISLHGPERGGGAAARGRRLAVVSFVRHR